MIISLFQERIDHHLITKSKQQTSTMQQDLSTPNMQRHQPLHHHLSRSALSSKADAASFKDDYDDCQTPAPKRQRRSRPKHQKSVHFAPTSNLLIIPTKSTQDVHSSWYTEQDHIHSKIEMSFCSKVMGQSSCVNYIEDIAYALATESSISMQSVQSMKRRLNPCERILTRGIEHSVSPTVLKLLAHRRKVVTRRVVGEQARLRQQSGRNDMGDAEALAQFSREKTSFSRDWAVLKLMDD
mmetsp:Transcript_13005/g.21306  ORF Transcript_13005/g.21306 Transcript_13005/m.21306 type:complete len:240 (+) Transcript_13005:34-753(+)